MTTLTEKLEGIALDEFKLLLYYFSLFSERMAHGNTSYYDWGPADICPHALILPILDERLWNPTVRAIIYLLAMFYFFLGVAIVTDVFMSSIEVITSTTRKVYLAKTRSKKVRTLKLTRFQYFYMYIVQSRLGGKSVNEHSIDVLAIQFGNRFDLEYYLLLIRKITECL